MSFLFHKKTKKVIHFAWAIIAVLIIVSMVLFFAPGLPEYLMTIFGQDMSAVEMATMPADKKILGSYLGLFKRMKLRIDAKASFADLASRYSEPHRAYHNLAHIQAMLAEFRNVRHLALKPNAVEFAIWYHDAIYDTRAKDNEEQSSKLARQVMETGSVSEQFVRSVIELILATKHTAAAVDPDQKLLADIDLSNLGQDRERFDQYEYEIRKEYAWVSDQDFIKGRTAVLKSFLERPFIYSTEHFREKYETKARENIARSLDKLANM